MKKDIHPEWYPEAEVVVEGEVVLKVGSTRPRLNVEIWSGTHPFYTGTQRLVDTEGQVDRFMRRLQRRKEIQEQAEEVRQAQSAEHLELEAMGLSTRVVNALKAAGMVTVGDVLETLNKGDDHLLALQGVGQKTVIDVKRFMRAEDLL